MTSRRTAPPVLVAIAGVFLTFAFWRALERAEAQAHQTLLDARAGAFKNEISARGEARAYALLRMAKRWEQRRSPIRSQWIPDASLYVEHYPSYRALLWVDRHWSPRWWVERNSDHGLITDADGPLSAAIGEGLAACNATPERLSSCGRRLATGDYIAQISAPVVKNGVTSGFIVGIFGIRGLFRTILSSEITGDYDILVEDGGVPVYRRGTSDDGQHEGAGALARLGFPTSGWNLHVWASPQTRIDGSFALSKLFLAGGIVATILLAILTHMIGRARRQTAALAHSNQQLQEEAEERRKAKQALRQRQAILEAVSISAERVLRVDSMEEGIPDLLARLGDTLSASRIYIFQNHAAASGELLATRCYTWAARSKKSAVHWPSPQDFSWQQDGMSRWAELLAQGNIVTGNVRDLPDAERELPAPYGIRSILGMPIFVDHTWWGFIGFDECRDERSWTDAEIAALKTAASVVGAAITRNQRERETRTAKHHLETLFTSITDAILVLDEHCAITDCNTAVEAVLGYTRAELLGRSAQLLYPTTEAYHEACETNARLIKDRGRAAGETMLRRKDRSDFPAYWTSSILEKNARNQIVAIVRDITAQKHAEQALRKSEALYRGVVEDQTELICRYGADGTPLFANGAYCRYFGLSEDALPGTEFLTLLSNNHPALVRQHFSYLSQETPVVTHERQVELPNAELRWQEWTDRAIFDSSGKIEEVQSVGRDITGRRRTEQQLRESEERFRQLVQHIHQVFWISDAEMTRMLYVSPAYETLWGRSCESLYENPQSFRESIHPDDRERVATELQRMVTEKNNFETEYRIVGAHDGIRWIYACAFPIEDDHGDVYRFAGIAEDITERRQAEETRIAIAEQQRDVLVQEVHHRIKNNLQAVVGLIRQRLGDRPQVKDILEEVLGQVHAIATVHGLHSRRPHGKLRIDELLTSIVGMAERVFSPPLSIHVGSSLGSVVELPDHEAVPIALIINELVSNAVKHSTNSSPIDVTLTSDRDSCRLHIANATRGLPAGFDFAGDTGLGMGLELVRSLMPPAGASLVFREAGRTVHTELTIAPPAIAIRDTPMDENTRDQS